MSEILGSSSCQELINFCCTPTVGWTRSTIEVALFGVLTFWMTGLLNPKPSGYGILFVPNAFLVQIGHGFFHQIALSVFAQNQFFGALSVFAQNQFFGEAEELLKPRSFRKKMPHLYRRMRRYAGIKLLRGDVVNRTKYWQ